MAINRAYFTGVRYSSWDKRRLKMAPKVAPITTSKVSEPNFPVPYVEGEMCFRLVNSTTVQAFCALADGEGSLFWMNVYIPDSFGPLNAVTGRAWESQPGLPFNSFIQPYGY